jgi:hypothetical protein
MAAIHLSHHNISPLPDKQLVLELKVREADLEGFNRFPCSFQLIEACPLDEDPPSATTQLSLDRTFRLEKKSRRRPWRSGGRAGKVAGGVPRNGLRIPIWNTS